MNNQSSASIKGIRTQMRLNLGSNAKESKRGCVESPGELPPPPEGGDLSALYARVDMAKKRKNRESGTGSR